MPGIERLLQKLYEFEKVDTPYFQIGSGNAYKQFGPEVDFRVSTCGYCVAEMHFYALKLLDQVTPGTVDLELFGRIKLRDWGEVHTTCFGTVYTNDLIRELAKFNLYVQNLLHPELSNDRLPVSVQSGLLAKTQGKFIRRQRIQDAHGLIDSESDAPVFQVLPNHWDPNGYRIEPYGEFELRHPTLIDGACGPVGEKFTPRKEWSEDLDYHTWYFDLATPSLAVAVIDILDRRISTQNQWPARSPEHPDNWRVAKLTDDVASFTSAERANEYGKDIDRDRWLFWKWQCGRFQEDQIIEEALRKGYQIGHLSYDKVKNLDEDVKNLKIGNARKTTRGYQKKYAKHIGVPRRAGK